MSSGVYNLERDFTPAPCSTAPGPKNENSSEAEAQYETDECTGGIALLDGWLAEVKARKLPPALRAKIVEKAASGVNKSDRIVHVARELLARGLSPGRVKGVLLCGRLGISEHCLKPGNDPERAANRAIAEAKQKNAEKDAEVVGSINRAVAEHSETYALVVDAPSTRVRDIKTGVNVTVQAHHQLMANKFVEGEDGKRKYISKEWMASKDRRTHTRVIFNPNLTPGGEMVDGVYPDTFNRWSGLSCEPIKGPWPKMQDHILKILCRKNEEHCEYFLNLLARCVQFPGKPGEVITVVRSPPGAGKGVTFQALRTWFGVNFLQVSAMKHVTGNFNGHQSDIVVLFGDEIFASGRKSDASALKVKATEAHTMSERKGVDAAPGENYLHVFLTSNEDWVAPIEEDDRRYFVLDAAPDRVGDKAYFEALLAERRNGGDQAMLFDLLARDISSFDVRTIPKTDALRAQKELSLSGVKAWLFALAVEGVLQTPNGSLGDLVDVVTSEWLYKSANLNHRNISKRAIAQLIKKPGARKVRRGVNGYQMPSLRALREWFETEGGLGSGVDWGDERPVNEQAWDWDPPISGRSEHDHF